MLDKFLIVYNIDIDSDRSLSKSNCSTRTKKGKTSILVQTHEKYKRVKKQLNQMKLVNVMTKLTKLFYQPTVTFSE